MNIPKKYEFDHSLFLKKKFCSRLIRKSDAGKLRVKVLIMKTKGKGVRTRYSGFYEDFADINAVGEVFADLYLLTERKPMRVAYQKGLVLIEEE